MEHIKNRVSPAKDAGVMYLQVTVMMRRPQSQ